MHRRRFNTLLKRRVSPYLFLATGVRAAKKYGVHPETLMVFEKGQDGATHFVVALTAPDGFSPREPMENDLVNIQSQDMDRVARGRESWANDVADSQMANQDAEKAEQERELQELFDDEVAPQVAHYAHHGRVYRSANV